MDWLGRAGLRAATQSDHQQRALPGARSGPALKAIGGQWRERFGYEPLLAETFTDPESHAGTCYKAAGWTPLGLTEGNRRQRAEFYVANERPKKLWLKPLRPDARERLCAAALAPPEHSGRQRCRLAHRYP